MYKKSNNKGYFLAETIVVIALVTSVMAYVFPNVSKVYDNYNNRSKFYDQTEDVYLLKAIAEYYTSLNAILNNGVSSNYMGYLTYDGSSVNLETYPDNTGAGCKKIGDVLEPISRYSGSEDFKADKYKSSDDYVLENLYITDYLSSPTDTTNYNFNKYLNRLKKNTSDSSSYRLIGVFKKDNSYRYASIKIENPNPKRNCNLGN